MLDSERTFKRTVKSHWKVIEIFLRQQLIAFKKTLTETKLSNIFKTTNVQK